MNLTCQKHLFQLSDDGHYLNCAYKAPLLRSSEYAAIEALERGRNPNRITTKDFFDQSELVRQEFGLIINSPAKNIAIISSTSYGFASLLLNVKGKPNGNAITIGDEFPSGYFALKKWCLSEDQEFTVVASNPNLSQQGKDWNERLLAAINDSTSVVLMSSIHWSTGLKYDLEAIGAKCRAVGAKFLIDGAQTIGALPLDVQQCNIDGLVCASYKCLFGAYSMCLMYVHEDFFDGIPLEEAWMNREAAQDFSRLSEYNDNYQEGAFRYNVGQTSFLHH